MTTVFDRFADHYDLTRSQLIPCFDAFYRSVVDLLPLAPTKHLDGLDLGAYGLVLVDRDGKRGATRPWRDLFVTMGSHGAVTHRNLDSITIRFASPHFGRTAL